jgi:hypothetical protein
MNRSERERLPGESANDAFGREVSAWLRRADPPPAHVIEAARDLLPWRTVDAALAEILREGTRKGRRGAR